MKFDISDGNFKGIINYFNNYNIPMPSTDAVKEANNDINDIIYHDKNPYITYKKDGTSGINLVFDFSFLRVKVTHYLLETGASGSPPTEWQLAGSNNLNDQWEIVDSTRENDTLCPYISGTSQCNARTVSSWKCSSPRKYYRYINFVVFKDRTETSNCIYLRLGGIEFYGYAYSFKSLNLPISHSTCRHFPLFTMINHLLIS